MKLSVIILNYKVPYHLLLCLQSVQKALQNLDAEIIVVDNRSEDESCQLVKVHFPGVVLFPNEKNEGFSKGNNRGVEIARGEYICFLNPDTMVAESVFKNLLQFAGNHPKSGAIGVKMIDGTGNFLPESKRNLPTPKVAFQKLLGYTTNYYAKNLNPNENGEVEILPGACMLMKKSRYMEVGGLDEDFFMYGEDIDLSYKFTKSGYQNYYCGEESILHFKGESTVKDAEYAKRFYGAMRLFHQKHFRSNFAMDFLVKNGLEVAKFSARLLSKSRKKTTSKIKETYLVAEGEGIVGEEIKNVFGTPRVISPTVIGRQKIDNTLLVFDVATLSFQQILTGMEKLKNQENQFRMLSTKFNFVIGSDQSAAKGKVLLL